MWALLPIYALTLFTSASLMFMLQPMFGKMILPLLGGSPLVWNTQVAFCQGVLLLGYLYAHLSTRWFGIRLQALIHCILLFLPLLFLPIGIPYIESPPVSDNPMPWLLLLLATTIGLPFFAVTTTSPLLQKWFASTRHPNAEDPYFLYSASNAGSLMGLLGYPVILEPYLHLERQAWLWGVGYLLLICLTLACALSTWRYGSPMPSSGWTEPGGFGGKNSCVPVTVIRRLGWILGAFIPSSLMLSVTNYLSSNIAPIPLLWVIPLALYLITLILAFARKVRLSTSTTARLFPASSLVLVIIIILQATQPIWLMFTIHLVVFFITSATCHGALAEDRPGTSHLTEFYLWVSLGGVLGGVFNSMVAPVVFPSILEYSLVLVVGALFLAWQVGSSHQWQDWLWAGGLGILTASLVLTGELFPGVSGSLGQVLVLGIPAAICYLFSKRPLRFALGMGAVLLASGLYTGGEGAVLYRERNFFGVHRILMDPAGEHHLLSHGGTLHGKQSVVASRRCEPLTYYHRTGPLGQIFAAFHKQSVHWRVAAVGLGAGSIAFYRRESQEWTFYEVDPAVVRIALDPRFFTYLSDCSTEISIVPGDARLSLSKEPDQRFDLLVLDAYTSGSIPIHLLTRQAFQLYLDKLTHGGLLVFHISNQYLDFRPVLGNLARDTGLVGLAQNDQNLSPEERLQGKEPSLWAIMARSDTDLGRLPFDLRWKPLEGDGGPVWTDSYSSLLNLLY